MCPAHRARAARRPLSRLASSLSLRDNASPPNRPIRSKCSRTAGCVSAMHQASHDHCLPSSRPRATLPPMGPTCSICQHPDRATIDQKLASGVPVLVISREHDLAGRRSSLYRHARSGHALGVKPPPKTSPTVNGGTHEAVAETILKATRLAKAAERHMRKALKSDDLKAANGALSSATKAFELFGKATGQLQTGGNVNVTVSATAEAAIAAQSQADQLSTCETAEVAGQYLAAQLQAGDADAVRIVGELMRMLPSADAAQGVTLADNDEGDRGETGAPPSSSDAAR